MTRDEALNLNRNEIVRVPTSEKMQHVEPGDLVCCTVRIDNGDYTVYPGDRLCVKEVYKSCIRAAEPNFGSEFLLPEYCFELYKDFYHARKERRNSLIRENNLYNTQSNINTSIQKFDNIKNQEETTMSMANELNKMFGAIRPGMCRLSMNGGVAVKTSGGYKSYNMKTGRLVNCDNFALDPGSEWFFCIPTNHVKQGDIILINGKPCCVKETDGDTITVINYENNTIEHVLPERHMFMGNMYFYSKVVSPFNSGKGGIKKLMKYAMMSEMMKGSFGGSDANGSPVSGGMFAGMNPMMLMMMGGGGGFGDLFDGMFDEDGEGFNMMGDLFGDEEDEAPTPPKKKGGKKAPKKAANSADDDEEDE